MVSSLIWFPNHYYSLLHKGESMNSYEKIKRDLNGRESKRLSGVSTYAREMQGNAVGVQYHNTTVVKAWQDGSFQLKDGGWQTVTTKERMNRYLPDGWYLCQKDFKWFLKTANGHLPYIDGEVYLVKEGESEKVS